MRSRSNVGCRCMIDRITSLALQRIMSDLPLAYITHQFWAPRAPMGVDINWAVVLTQFVLVQLNWMTESTIHLIHSLGVFVLTVNGSGLAYKPWPYTKNSSRRIPSPLRSTTNFQGGGYCFAVFCRDTCK